MRLLLLRSVRASGAAGSNATWFAFCAGVAAFAGSGATAAPSPRQDDAPPPKTRFEYTRVVMGAEARLVLHAPDEETARAAATAAFARMSALDDALSDYRVDGPLARLNAAAGRGPCPADALQREALRRANAFAALTGGAFDATVGPLTRLWREAREREAMPDAAALESARRAVGWRDAVLDDDAGTIELKRAGMALDFGGIGMGMAVDAAFDELRARDAEPCMVDFSGDVRCGAAPPGTDGWHVALGNGRARDDAEVLVLVDQALATSGPTEQALVVGATRYSHVLDPRTGLGLTSPCVYTVLAADATTADALSSAAGVLGLDRAREVLREAGARLIVEDPELAALFASAGRPTGEGMDREFVSLLDGGPDRPLGHFEAVGDADGYRIVDGVLEIPARGGGYLRTRESLRDFALTLEFQLSPMANSGVFLRARPGDENPAYSGCEVQLLDDFDWEAETGTTLRPWQFTGSLYGAVPPGDRDALRPIGAWNRLEIVFRGRRIETVLNGHVLYDADTAILEPESGAPFAERAEEGFIGLQRYGAPGVLDPIAARFRRVFVKRL